MITGTIINVQKYSIHDGPGIRTSVFLKGCPLRCWWCHNPESLRCKHQVMFFKEKCAGCGVCAKECEQGAMIMKDDYPFVDYEKCNLCGRCTDVCLNEARQYIGKDVSVQELMKEIIKDEVFYEESNGGVTFSGGEPLVQIDFLNEMLKACNERKIHTCVDTSGYSSWENISGIVDKVDLFLYDLKLIDDEKHKKYIGVSNVGILENLKKLSNLRKKIYVRMPIIAGINDDDDNIHKSVEFLRNLNITQVNILPYHKMGMDKYDRLEIEYKLTGMEKPSDERVFEIESYFKNFNIKVKIGG